MSVHLEEGGSLSDDCAGGCLAEDDEIYKNNASNVDEAEEAMGVHYWQNRDDLMRATTAHNFNMIMQSSSPITNGGESMVVKLVG